MKCTCHGSNRVVSFIYGDGKHTPPPVIFMVAQYEKLILHLRWKMKQEMPLCEEIPEQIKLLVCKVLKRQNCHDVTLSTSLHYKFLNCFQRVGGAVQHQVSHQAVNINWNSYGSRFKHIVMFSSAVVFRLIYILLH